jgi:hypothetical protein
MRRPGPRNMRQSPFASFESGKTRHPVRVDAMTAQQLRCASQCRWVEWMFAEQEQNRQLLVGQLVNPRITHVTLTGHTTIVVASPLDCQANETGEIGETQGARSAQ